MSFQSSAGDCEEEDCSDDDVDNGDDGDDDGHDDDELNLLGNEKVWKQFSLFSHFCVAQKRRDSEFPERFFDRIVQPTTPR